MTTLVPRHLDRYEATLPEPTEFRDEAVAASWRRARDASRYLADHLLEAPALVLFLQPLIPWTPRDDQGEMDIGRLDASVYPAVQNFCVAARSLGLGTALTTVIRIHTADVLAELGVPEGRFEIAALVPVGRPAGRFGVAPRKPADTVTHSGRVGRSPLPHAMSDGYTRVTAEQPRSARSRFTAAGPCDRSHVAASARSRPRHRRTP